LQHMTIRVAQGIGTVVINGRILNLVKRTFNY